MEEIREDFASEEIYRLRVEIDSIDNAIADLLSQRMDFVKRIHQLKQLSGTQIEDLGREQRILSRLQRLHPHLNSEWLTRIYRVIFSAFK